MTEDIIAFSGHDAVEKVLTLTAVPPGFTVRIAANFPKIIGSPTGFELVLRNLISNAIIHNDAARPAVALRSRIEGGAYVVEVSDDGPGVAAEDRESNPGKAS